MLFFLKKTRYTIFLLGITPIFLLAIIQFFLLKREKYVFLPHNSSPIKSVFQSRKFLFSFKKRAMRFFLAFLVTLKYQDRRQICRQSHGKI
jgi:hypothetical protein